MKKTGKIIIYAVLTLFILAGALIGYVKLALPDVGDPPDIKVELTPQRIEKGRYLANHVMVCIDCHSTRNWTKFSAPLDTTTIGTGGDKFDANVGFPGEVYTPNITPYHIKDWTDGEIFRAITAGVKKDGSPIFPIMPYTYYGKLDKEDIYSVIAYLRTLPEKKTSSPERRLDFPLNILVNTMPVKGVPQEKPSEDNTLAYGAYLVNAAACKECHTKNEKGKLIEGMDFAGGAEFKLPGGAVYSANITPDQETGIGKWTTEQFVSTFKAYEDVHKLKEVNKTDFQTIMPWSMYAGMKVKDLEAIFSYLKTLKPISNRVEKFVPLASAD